MTRSWIALILVACGGGVATDSGQPEDLVWYATCGAPVCSTGTLENPEPTGDPLCSDLGVARGDGCADEGALCDALLGCDARLICAAEDPLADPNGCPKSLRRYKENVSYLTSADKARAAEQALGLPLATWRYKGALDDGKTHLGFLIDDVPGSPAVQADGAHVDLYGYTSLAIAALQQQQKELEALRAEVAALKQSCAAR